MPFPPVPMPPTDPLPRRRCLSDMARTAAWLAAPALPAAAWAAARQVSIVVPYPAGGAMDRLGRLLAQGLGQQRGEVVLVDNHPGASGTLGMRYLAQARPDGRTIGIGTISTLALLPNARRNLGYDPLASFAPIGRIGTAPLLLVTHASLKAPNPLALARQLAARSGFYNYASVGEWSVPHVATERLASLLGLRLVHVPYQSSQAAVVDLLAGRLHLMLDQPVTFGALLQDPRLQVHAVLAPRRAALLPDVPTAAEAGLGDIDIGVWSGLLAPAGTPASALDTLHGQLQASLGDADVRATLASYGIEPDPGTPSALTALMKAQLQYWSGSVGTAVDTAPATR